MGVVCPELSREREHLECLNRARDFFGDTCQRQKDRLILEHGIWPEDYSRGRMALVLDCDFPVVGVSQSDAAGFVHEVSSISDRSAFLILKADINNPHKLQGWDEKLMLIADIHLVQGPDGVIPSRVGFYRIHHEGPKFGSNLPLLQSTLEPLVYKSFALIEDWETGMRCRSSLTTENDLVVHQIESASKVVQRIPGSKGDFIGGKQIFSDVDTQEILASLCVVINSRSVAVRVVGKGQPKRVNVRDVLVGPLNLFV